MSRVLLTGIAALAACALLGCGADPAPPPPDEDKAVLDEVYGLLKVPAEQGKPPARRLGGQRVAAQSSEPVFRSVSTSSAPETTASSMPASPE